MRGDKFGYTRCSTTKQDQDYQRELLLKHGVPERNIRWDTFTGRVQSRPGFSEIDKLLRKGDTIYITQMWRAGRCDETAQWLIDLYTKRGVDFVILDCEWLGPSASSMDPAVRNGLLWFMSYMGKQYLEALSYATKNSMMHKKAYEHMKSGRKPIEPETAKLIRDYHAQGWSRNKISLVLNVARSTVWNYIHDETYSPAMPRKADSTLAKLQIEADLHKNTTVNVQAGRAKAAIRRNGHVDIQPVIEPEYAF